MTRQLLAGSAAAAPVERLFATCRDPQSAQALRRLESDFPNRLEVLRLDLEDEESWSRARDFVSARVEHLDLIINASGLLHDSRLTPEKRLRDLDASALARSFAVNATGPVLVLRELVELLPRRSASIIASLSARVGSIEDNRLGGWYSYRASKAALNMLHRCLAIELARSHRHAVAVVLHPGTVDTNLSRPFQGNVAEERLFSTERAASQLLEVMAALGPADTGSFLAWDGKEIPW